MFPSSRSVRTLHMETIVLGLLRILFQGDGEPQLGSIVDMPDNSSSGEVCFFPHHFGFDSLVSIIKLSSKLPKTIITFLRASITSLMDKPPFDTEFSHVSCPANFS